MRKVAGPVFVRLLAAVTVIVLVGCASPRDEAASHGVAPGSVSAPASGDEPAASQGHRVVLDGRDLVLVTEDGRERQLASLTDEDGDVVHLSLRPGEHATRTVLAVTRVDDDLGARYELRYLFLSGGEVTDLYWFPWRLQIDEGTVEVLDAPPIPVWAPDGRAVAWVEWTDQGTRLRTVGWLDHSEGTNPSDDAATYALEDVPAGTQLRSWEDEPDGTSVLTGTFEDQQWEIRLGAERITVAMRS